jgi:hypothetical protein
MTTKRVLGHLVMIAALAVTTAGVMPAPTAVEYAKRATVPNIVDLVSERRSTDSVRLRVESQAGAAVHFRRHPGTDFRWRDTSRVGLLDGPTLPADRDFIGPSPANGHEGRTFPKEYPGEGSI